MAGRSNPNDARYANNPDYRYDEATGRWFYKNNPSPLGTAGDLPWKDPVTGEMIDPNSDTVPSQEQLDDINRQAEGGAAQPGMPDYTAYGYGDPSGLNKTVPEGAPGSELDTSAPDEERMRLGTLLAQLRGQAETGGGAWEQALKTSTDASKKAATALAQSADIDPMEARGAMGEARAAADQKAAGQAELLRNQTKQQAQGDIADVLSQQATLDAAQAGTQGAVRQGVRSANTAITENANTANRGIYKAAGDVFMKIASMGMGASKGGTVPGEPEVFGDHEANDTVPAMLSPGEIVIPRSIAQGPDASGRAAAFVAALKSRGEKSHFDEGGIVPWKPGDIDPSNSVKVPGFSLDIPTFSQDPNVLNGSVLDTTQYDQTRKDVLENSDRLLASSQGKGPSVAPQRMSDATHESISAALHSNAGRGGMGGQGAALNSILGAGQDAQKAAGEAATTVAGETTKGGQQFAQAIQRQRAQDLAMAGSQQAAQWRNTLTNMGVSLDRQQQLLGMIAAGGQAAMSVMQMFPELQSQGGFDPSANVPEYEDPQKPWEWEDPYVGGDSTMSRDNGGLFDPELGKAHGGEITDYVAKSEQPVSLKDQKARKAFLMALSER